MRSVGRRLFVGSGCVEFQRHELIGDEGVLDVLWQTEVHGSGPLGLGELETPCGTISGIDPGVRIRSAHLVTGENMDTRSTL